jgi:cytochrome c oxidase assembly protein subunit 15
MTTTVYSPLLHRFAALTLMLALLPIIAGALVTTLDAGMAFRDWPSSDGYNLFFYPWLKSAGDKFIEHGHRLAGALIGFVSIGLAGMAWKLESRKSVRFACYAVLLAVIVQGILGGGRVRLDARTLAMVHGSFAALVFGLMAAVCVVTSRSWTQGPEIKSISNKSSGALSVLSGIVCGAVFLQFLLGGFVRHLGMALHEHLAGAILVTVLVLATTTLAHRSKVPLVKRAGWLMFGFLMLQVSLGLGAWVMKFGIAPTGYVAVVNSTPHVAFRTAHTVSGMLLLASAVSLKLKTMRFALNQQRSETVMAPMTGGGLTLEGGLR